MTTVPAGGPSTINGIVYQMLWSLLRTVQLSVRTYDCDQNGVPVVATIVLEPRGGGGDLVEETPGGRVVQQLKARSDGGTWSLGEVVKGVLPDLYRAVDLGRPDTGYELITEGRLGDWEEVNRIFGSLAGRIVPQDHPIAALDAIQEIHFARGQSSGPRGTGPIWTEASYTERSLFEEIVRFLRERTSATGNEPILETQQKLWHLLANFRFVQGRALGGVQSDVDDLLLALVGKDFELPRVRDAMLWDLASQARSGSAEIVAKDFLAKHGLDGCPLTSWNALKVRAHEHLNEQLKRLQYYPRLDVRTEVKEVALEDWPEDKPMLALVGTSGQGKTWRTAAILRALEAQLPIVIFVSGTGASDKDLQEAEKAFQDIRNTDEVLPLKRVGARLRTLGYPGFRPWLTLAIDGVQNAKEARELALYPWEDWGVRLLVSGSDEVASTFSRHAAGRARQVLIEDFSLSELADYLGRRVGPNWPDIPADVRRTLRRPLLARLYADIARAQDWKPTNEYELYAQFWQRLHEDEMAEYPLDRVPLMRLARAITDGAPYPWTLSQLSDSKLDSDAILRLQQVDWLRTAEHERYEIPHDRLLNWAVAQALLEAHQTGELDAQPLAQKIHELWHSPRTNAGRSLGYVPMDVVWLASSPPAPDFDVVDAVLDAMEADGWQTYDAFYRGLLPTAGERIVPVLYQRLETAAVKDDWPLVEALLQGLMSVSGSTVPDGAVNLLKHESPGAQQAAARVLGQRPSADALDRLWEIHCAISSDLDRDEGQTSNRPSARRILNLAALRSCARERPSWLEARVQQADAAKEPMGDLVYLLSELDDASAMWLRLKPVFFNRVPPDEHWRLAVNIRRWRDASEVDWLAAQVSSDADGAGALALRALVTLDPERALQEMERLSPEELSLSRRWCLHELLDWSPAPTLERFRTLLRRQADPWQVAGAFQGRENAIDAATLDLLLDALEPRLEAALAEADSCHENTLTGELRLLAGMHRLELIEQFEKRRGTPFAAKLTAWLLRIGAQPGPGIDRIDREPGIAVLCKTGADGLTRVVNMLLGASTRFGRAAGLRLAGREPDQETGALVRGLATQPGVEGHILCERQKAIEALAGIGNRSLLLDAVMQQGLPCLLDLVNMELDGESFTDDDIAVALAAVRDEPQPPPGALLAIGMSRRVDRAHDVRRALERVAPESLAARAALFALIMLADDSPDAVSALACQLRVPEHEEWAVWALLQNGTQAALDLLCNHLAQRYNQDLAADLLNTEPCALRAAELVQCYLARLTAPERVREFESLLRSVNPSGALDAIIATGKLQDHVHKLALGDSHSIWVGTRAAAIRVLARHDPHMAFLAARAALRDSTTWDREVYPRLLLEVAPENAIAVLLDQVEPEESTAFIWAIGRALARQDLEKPLLDLLKSEQAQDRQRACLVAGFQPPSEPLIAAVRALTRDVDDEVIDAAREALEFLTAAVEVRKLIIALHAETDSQRRWVLLDAVIALADPGDTHGPWPDWANDFAGKLPRSMVPYIQRQLEKRRDEVARLAKSRDWDTRR